MSGTVIPFPVPVRAAAPEPCCPCGRRLQRVRAALGLWLHPLRTVRMARDCEQLMTVALNAWADYMREHRGA